LLRTLATTLDATVVAAALVGAVVVARYLCALVASA